MITKQHHGSKQTTRARLLAAAVAAFAFSTTFSPAIDPPYQDEMQRLNEIMGSLYFLQPLCVETPEDWRAEAAELIALDVPDADRKQRLMGAFNEGYQSYARLYRWCSEPASAALNRLLLEAERTTRSIHARFAE